MCTRVVQYYPDLALLRLEGPIPAGPQREILSPLEASHDHLLITPPSHRAQLKVRGFVVGLIDYAE
jgi:hypothetical protein